jgi:hypothetical protein
MTKNFSYLTKEDIDLVILLLKCLISRAEFNRKLKGYVRLGKRVNFKKIPIKSIDI